MKSISQNQLDTALRSHFAATAEPSDWPRSPRLDNLPAELKSGGSRATAVVLAAMIAIAIALAGLPLLVSRTASPQSSQAPSATATETATASATGTQTDTSAPTETEWPTGTDSAISGGSGAPGATDSGWWRTAVDIEYMPKVKADTRDYVTVAAKGAARCGPMTVNFKTGLADQQIGGFDQWRDPSARPFIDVPETFVGAAHARLVCWRDGANAGPWHTFNLVVTVLPADPWNVTARVEMDLERRAGTVQYTISRPFASLSGCLFEEGTNVPGGMSWDVQPTSQSGSLDFQLKAEAPEGTTTYAFSCTDRWGVKETASGTFEAGLPPAKSDWTVNVQIVMAAGGRSGTIYVSTTYNHFVLICDVGLTASNGTELVSIGDLEWETTSEFMPKTFKVPANIPEGTGHYDMHCTDNYRYPYVWGTFQIAATPPPTPASPTEPPATPTPEVTEGLIPGDAIASLLAARRTRQ